MKFLLALVLCIAASQALPRANVVTPRVVEFPEWALNPRLTGSEWEAIREANAAEPEQVANYRPGTVPQIESAGTSYADSRIIGGSNAASGQFPWQVSITMDSSYFCGGSVISEEWVLTAGHCADGISTFSLVFGTLNPDGDSGSVKLTSRNGIPHENYNGNTIRNDIAVIKLASKLTFSTRISSVRLPSRSQASDLLVGEAVTISGWGLTSDSASSISSSLKWVGLEVITNTLCAATYGTTITAGNICTRGEVARATCNGDSGGPLIHQESDGKYTEVGIVSFGSSAGCQKGYPDAFTRVTYFLSWIETNTGIAIRN